MSQITNFKIKPADYRGRDEIIVRRSDFNQETLETEAKNTLYYLFSYAHGKRCHLAYTKPACSRVAANISSRGPKVLEPPWTAISDPTHPLIDAKFFPPNFPMSDPAVMRQPRRVELLHHILNLEHLQFHHWKPRNGTPQLPVPLDLRYWADEQRDQEARQLELAREKALDARPTHTSNDDYEDYGSAGEDVVPDGPAGQPVAGPSTQRLSDPPTLRPAGPRQPGPAAHRPAPSLPVFSPYGSSRIVRFHNEDDSRDDELHFCPPFVDIPDPDDLMPPHGLQTDTHAPCSVPHTSEARAQWALSALELPTLKDKTSFGHLRSCISALAELPVRCVTSHRRSILTPT